MNNFWQEQHKTKNEYWLSGTNNAEYILDLHKIDRNINNNKILDIGVGMGHLSRYLHSKKNTMFCSDISQIALDNLNDIASTYLTSDLSRIEPVDIAICNLVFQHCDDNEIQRILKDVQLKDSGFFTFQFAFLREGEEPNHKVKHLISIGTHHFRSLDKIKEMVKIANKKIIEISEPIHYYGDENFSWYIVKVGNN